MSSGFDEIKDAFRSSVGSASDFLSDEALACGMAAALRRLREKAERDASFDALAVCSWLDELLRQSGEGGQ